MYTKTILLTNMPRNAKTTIDFITEASKVHGDLYDYSKVKYTHALKKIIIKCKIHDDFEQTPNKHIRGSGCPKCIRIRKTNDQFIIEASKVHGDLYDYSKVNYVNATTKVVIICKTHGEFEQLPSNNLKGQGCSKCSGRNKTIDEFIIESCKVHYDLYDYSKVNYVNATTKVVIVCKIHGDFEQSPTNHLGGNRCPKCSGKGKTNEDAITESIKVHGDLYDYSKVNYVNATTKVVIVCKIHGDFKQLLSSHLYGSGCRKCSTIKNSELQRSNKDTFILIASKSHNGLYDYSKVNYVNATTKVVIVCKIHGDFEQSPNNHTHNDRPRGCPLCANIKTADSQRSNIDIFIKRASEVHGDLYDYSKVEYINCEQKIIIKCKAHGEFKQRPQHHLNGTRCPRCNNRGFLYPRQEQLYQYVRNRKAHDLQQK